MLLRKIAAYSIQTFQPSYQYALIPVVLCLFFTFSKSLSLKVNYKTTITILDLEE